MKWLEKGGAQMYKAFFTHYMENEPTSVTEKYIFIVDNEEVAQAISHSHTA